MENYKQLKLSSILWDQLAMVIMKSDQEDGMILNYSVITDSFGDTKKFIWTEDGDLLINVCAMYCPNTGNAQIHNVWIDEFFPTFDEEIVKLVLHEIKLNELGCYAHPVTGNRPCDEGKSCPSHMYDVDCKEVM